MAGPLSISLSHTDSEFKGNPEALDGTALGTFLHRHTHMDKEKLACVPRGLPRILPEAQPWPLMRTSPPSREENENPLLHSAVFRPSRLTAKTVLLDETSFYFSTSHFLFCNYCQEVFTGNMVDFWQPVMWERDELFLCAALGLTSGWGGAGKGVPGHCKEEL